LIGPGTPGTSGPFSVIFFLYNFLSKTFRKTGDICPECPAVDHLVTLGSPLGIDEVQDKLKHPGLSEVDFPSEKLKGEWVNIFDHLDPVVAFDPYFANDYRKGEKKVVKDINEQNWGDWRHSIQKYLSGPRLRSELRRLLNL